MDTQSMNRNILQATYDIHKSMPNQNQYVDDTIIANRLGFSIQDVQDGLDLLDDQRFVKLLKTKGPEYGVMLTALGRTWLRDPNYLQQQTGASSPPRLSGMFYIILIVVSVALPTIVFLLTGELLSTVVISFLALLIIVVIGAFRLRQEKSLSEKNFIHLVNQVIKPIPSLIKAYLDRI